MAKKDLTSSLDTLRDLCNLVAVAGDEGPVRRYILEAIRPHVDSVHVDALGNILAAKKGKTSARVLVAAHMDEIGLMITGHDSDGSLRFDVVGGVDERALPGKTVWVGRQRLPGVIGAAPIHLVPADRRQAALKTTQLRIDIGATSAETAKGLAKAGDRATFATDFAQMGDSLAAKALDDRLGCATLIELLQAGPYPCDLHAAFTVQEEVGLRGAKVAGFATDPHVAFVLDCTPAYDLPDSRGYENTQYNARLGAGPAIYVADRATLYDERLVQFAARTAQAAGLPHQFRQPGGGGTDAGSIHRARAGVPSLSISVPGRYLHTARSVVRHSDWVATVRLLQAMLLTWSADVLA